MTLDRFKFKAYIPSNHTHPNRSIVLHEIEIQRDGSLRYWDEKGKRIVSYLPSQQILQCTGLLDECDFLIWEKDIVEQKGIKYQVEFNYKNSSFIYRNIETGKSKLIPGKQKNRGIVVRRFQE